MNIEVHGRQLEVTDPIREHATRKVERLSRLLPDDVQVDVELWVERNPRIAEAQIAELSMFVHGDLVRARHAATDMYAAIDGLLDRVKRQLGDRHARRTRSRSEGRRIAGLNEAV